MAFLSKRYCINIFFAAAFFSVFLVCLAAGIGTWRLNASKSFFLNSLNERFPSYRLQAGTIFFLPPNCLIINDFHVQASQTLETEHPRQIFMRIPTMILRFSAKDYFIKKKITVSLIYLKSLQSCYQDLLALGTAFQSQFREPAGEGPSRFTLKLRNARLLSLESGFNPGQGHILSAVFRLNRQQMELKGRLCPPHSRSCSAFLPLGWFPSIRAGLRFLLSVELGMGQSLIKDLMIRHPRGEGTWQGRWDGHTAELTGYALWDTRRHDGAKEPFLKRLGIAALRLDPNLFILDIKSKVTVAPSEIRMDNLHFNVNTIPVQISGMVGTAGAPSAHFSFTVDSSKLEKFFPGWHKVLGEVHSEPRDGRWMSSARVALSARPSSVIAREAEVVLEMDGLRIKKVNQAPGLAIDTLTVVSSFGRVQLTGLDMFWNTRLNNMDYLSFTGGFYAGQLSGRAWVLKYPGNNIRPFMALNLSNIRLDDCHRDWPGLSILSGRLSGRYFVLSDPKFSVKGQMLVTDGILTRVRFLEWFSAAFGFKAMKQLQFDTLSFSTVMDATGVHVDRLSLTTDHVHIRGNLSLSSQKMVTSRLSILLDSAYVAQSSELVQLLKEKTQDSPNYNFEFQLSGPSDTINFQWLPSHVKDLIQKRIPDFMERRIERNIDQMIKASP